MTSAGGSGSDMIVAMKVVVSLVGLGLVFAGAVWAQGIGASKPQPASQTKSTDLKPSEPVIHRLILKDGSFQVVSKYEIKHLPGGDRVRYISAERGGDWEEIPYSLIDWKATQDYAKQHENDGLYGDESRQQEAAAIDEEEKADRNRNLEVAPNLRLPDETGIWALDYFHDSPELAELVQSSVNEQTGHSVLRAALNPSGATRQTIELNERHAKAAMHEALPVFYVSIDEENSEPGVDALTVDTHGASSAKKAEERSAATSQYVIVRAAVKKDFRLVGTVKINALGNAEPAENVTLTRSELLPGKRWMKLTPKDPLPAGDYVLMEVLSPREVNLSVWDFRIDPGAGDNANAILPLQRIPIAR